MPNNHLISSEVITGLIAGVTAIIVALITKAKITFSAKERMYQNMGRLAEGMAILEHQVSDEDSGIERAVMFEGHNCGGQPSPDKPYFVDVIQPRTVAIEGHLTAEQIKEKYSNLPVDSHYIYMLRDLLKKEHILFDVGEMPTCLLKDIYTSNREEVKHSLVSLVGIRGNSIIFISQATTSAVMSAETLFNAKLAARKIKNLIR